MQPSFFRIAAPVVLAVLGFVSAAHRPAGAQDVALAPRNYYVEPRSYGTRRDTEPPSYVRPLDQTGIERFKDVDWIDVGLDHRTRFEVRDNDYRRDRDTVDLPVLLRIRSYFGIREILDPFRFYVEFEDAERENGKFPRDDRDINQTEVIQAVGELYAENGLGPGRPLRLQGGRMAFEYIDRRLIARNEWRNTTNNFQGFRAILGREQNDWQVDLLALQPVKRKLYDFDEIRDDQWFYAVIGNWRRWSRIVTLQPYYLGLEQNGTSDGRERSIYSPALRGYGIIGDSGFDYDAGLVVQFGKDSGRDHRAVGFTTEIGRTFAHSWKPRTSAFFGYGSGDKDPDDNKSERFERFFGFARPWSNNDYFQWENIIAPKARVEFQPAAALRIDTGYSVYWLASDTDRWNNANLRDPTGNSGSFVGHEFDVRSRYKLTSHIDTNIGYAFFTPGGFTRSAPGGRSSASNFFYVEITVSAFE
jgi:hypothetical protein